MGESKFQFGDIVIVEGYLVGVIVKIWERVAGSNVGTFHYEVYVRNYNEVCKYEEKEIKHYILHKELSEDDKEYYS